jgi:beta-aspartyl-peptidase (threonine type)
VRTVVPRDREQTEFQLMIGGHRFPFPLSLALVALFLLPGCAAMATHRPASAQLIRGLLADQAAAWNRGSVDEYMKPYWHSDDLTFSSGGQTRRGFAATREAYLRRYPTPEQMGQLAFDDLEIRWLGGRAALVLGRWCLTRANDSLGGNFSLVLQVFDGRWQIIHDHTSAAEDSAP